MPCITGTSQLKVLYKDNADIIGNCDSMIFLGGKKKLPQNLSESLGKETIDMFNTSDTRGHKEVMGLIIKSWERSL